MANQIPNRAQRIFRNRPEIGDRGHQSGVGPHAHRSIRRGRPSPVRTTRPYSENREAWNPAWEAVLKVLKGMTGTLSSGSVSNIYLLMEDASIQPSELHLRMNAVR